MGEKVYAAVMIAMILLLSWVANFFSPILEGKKVPPYRVFFIGLAVLESAVFAIWLAMGAPTELPSWFMFMISAVGFTGGHAIRIIKENSKQYLRVQK